MWDGVEELKVGQNTAEAAFQTLPLERGIFLNEEGVMQEAKEEKAVAVC